jgi:3-ketosteroid 9alpha-monooxygenase subunit B
MANPSGDHDPVLRVHGYHQLAIKQVVRETDDASSFVLDVPGELAGLFSYRPGQFCTFRVHIAGVEQLRSYSMSSAPETDRDLTVTVKRVAGGLVSNWMLDNLTAGDVLEVTKPAGVFCPQETGRPVMALCGGSGITPVMSVAKHVLSTSGRDFKLLYANRDRASVIFDQALHALSDRYAGRVELRSHFDTDGGFLTAEAVGDFARGGLDGDFYICGPGPFMDLVESSLGDLGVAPERIFIERFLVEQQEKDAQALAPSSDTSTDIPAQVTVILGGKTTVIDYHARDTVLETARRGGLRPPFSCEAGNCATCMAFLKSGSVTMRANNALTDDEVAEGWILTCQSLPSGQDVVVEYEAL